MYKIYIRKIFCLTFILIFMSVNKLSASFFENSIAPNIKVSAPEFSNITPKYYHRKNNRPDVKSWVYHGNEKFIIAFTYAAPEDRVYEYQVFGSSKIINTFKYFRDKSIENINWNEQKNTNIGYMSAVRFRFSGKVCFAIRGHFNVSDHGDDEARPTHGIALSYCENGYAELPVSKMNYILSNVSVGSEGKEKVILESDVKLSKENTTTSTNEDKSIQEYMSSVWIPVRINLEDRTTAINGKLQYENNSDHGLIKFKTSDAGINCSGKWRISTGSSSNNETVKGVWEVSCSDGRTVTGQYESNEKGSGSGVGYDNSGRKVTIRFGRLAIQNNSTPIKKITSDRIIDKKTKIGDTLTLISDNAICRYSQGEENKEEYKREVERRGISCKNELNNIKTTSKPKLDKPKSEKNISNNNQKDDQTEKNKRLNLKKYEDKCLELGFTKGTEKFGDCVMKLIDM